MNASPQQTYSIRLPAILRQQLQELAEAEDRKPADMVRRLIKQAYRELEQRQQPAG